MVLYHPLKCLLLTFSLTTYFPTNYAQQENSTIPEVTIDQGILQGIIQTTRYNRSVFAFLGIPYAQPPIGDLRFANPVAAGGWNGTLDASTNPSRCPQITANIVSGEEDCLYINVITPQLPDGTNSTLLPVMVYIHGGAYKVGSLSTNPGYLLDKDVILISLSYRLGPLGFLSTGDEIASGNWGLKDQVLALEWVRDNIAKFGGDPDRVTLFGESGGSICVHLLTLSDLTIGLFHRYITQSGSALATWAHRPSAAYSNLAFQLGTYVGCSHDTSDSLINCLRNVSVSDIIATESRFMVWQSLPDIIWGPTDEPDIDGAFLTDSPANLLAAGKIRDLPWISGVVRDEGLLLTKNFYQDEEIFDEFLENFDTLLPIMSAWTYQSDSGAAWVNATKSYYFNDDLTMNTTELLSNLTIFASDCHFFYPAYKALQQHHAVAENPQYFYTFNYRGSFSFSYLYTGTMVDYGVVHGDDLIYLFPTTSLSPDPNATLSDTDYEMVDIMVQLWTSFAINGTPTALALNGGITWEPYSADDNYLRIGTDGDSTLEAQYSFFDERMRFWNSIDALVEEEDTLVDDSGTVTAIPNLLLWLLIACAKYVACL